MSQDQTKWTELLQMAVTQPGAMMKAYSAFHGYSLGNQMLALIQCEMRKLEPGPINTYAGWQQLGRQVRKGERALTLCMPLTCKKENERGEPEQFIKAFVYKPRWFVLTQTEGEPVATAATPGWEKQKALAALGITETTFTHTDGNVQGYAKGREVAISPIAAMPQKTLLHELAHVELGHTQESGFTDSERTPRCLREAEAESVALLCLDALNLPGSEFCRGYIQNWLNGDIIPEASAQKIFSAADRILRAGRDEN